MLSGTTCVTPPSLAASKEETALSWWHISARAAMVFVEKAIAGTGHGISRDGRLWHVHLSMMEGKGSPS